MHLLRLLAVGFALAGCERPGAPGAGELAAGLRVCAGRDTVEGIDVSHWDGAIDWGAVRSAGVAFAYVKATEGVTFVDPAFDASWSGALAHGVLRGAYHFFRPAVDPVAQADHFLRIAGVPTDGDLAMALDLETTDGLDPHAAGTAALAFLARVADRTGRAPLVYTSSSVFAGVLGSPAGFDDYGLWVASWEVGCPDIPSPPWGAWSFWQYTDSGTIAGIDGHVDRDRFNGSLADLRALAGAGGRNDGGAIGGDGGGAGPADGAGGDSRPGASDGLPGAMKPGSSGCSVATGRARPRGRSLPGLPPLLVAMAVVATRRGRGGRPSPA